jgi:hypothetical protein
MGFFLLKSQSGHSLLLMRSMRKQKCFQGLPAHLGGVEEFSKDLRLETMYQSGRMVIG